MQERGGIVVGSPHSEGGVPFVLQDTGTHIEEEGGEINIPVELALSPQIYTLKGTNAEILQQILKKANLSISDKVTTVKSGDIVICVKSAWDNEVREITGTIAQILSAINTSRGCKLIEPGAKVVSENGIEKKHSGGAVADKKILPFHERMRLLQEHPKEFLQVFLGKGGEVLSFSIPKKTSKRKMQQLIEDTKKLKNDLSNLDLAQQTELEKVNELKKEQEKILNERKKTLYDKYEKITQEQLERYYSCFKTMPNDLIDLFIEKNILNLSPYSCSSYSCQKTWDYTAEGCYTITDHFNFESRGKYHKLTTTELQDEVEKKYGIDYWKEEQIKRLGKDSGFALDVFHENFYWYLAIYDSEAVPYLIQKDEIHPPYSAKEKGAWKIIDVWKKDYEKEKVLENKTFELNEISDKIRETQNRLENLPEKLAQEITTNEKLIELGFSSYNDYKKFAVKNLKHRYNSAYFSLGKKILDGIITASLTKKEYQKYRGTFRYAGEEIYTGNIQKVNSINARNLIYSTMTVSGYTGMDFSYNIPENSLTEDESQILRGYMKDEHFPEIIYSKHFKFDADNFKNEMAERDLSSGENPDIEIKQDVDETKTESIETPPLREESEITQLAKGGTIKDKVLVSADELKAMKTHGELYRWAKEHDMDTRAAFPRYKIALKEIGIDYEAIRSGVKQQKEEELQKSLTHEITLYVDAKASADRFAITDEDGDVLWYGKFFESDSDYNGEQSSAELSAAKKAVWFASKIKETIDANAIRLNLFVDAQWLTYQDHAGQKGYILTQLANRYNVDLNVEWIPGSENPADKWTTESGYKKWSDNDLSSLAKPISEEKEKTKTPEDFVREEIISGNKIKLRNNEPNLKDSVFTSSTYQGAGSYVVAVGDDGIINAAINIGMKNYDDVIGETEFHSAFTSGIDIETIKKVAGEMLLEYGKISYGEGSGTGYFAIDEKNLEPFLNKKIYEVPNINLSEKLGRKIMHTNYEALPPENIEKKYYGGAVAGKKILPFHERMRLLQEHPKEFVQVLLGKGGGIAFQETKGQKVSKQQDVQIINSNSPRWQKKKNGITALSNNIHRLRSKVTRDLNGDEKEFLTALIIMMMDKTGERIGNDDSARNGHYGISGLRKKHISVIGDKVHLSYTGKSGVLHEKSFSDERIARALKKAIKNSPNRFVFSTTAGFIIKADKVNRYLQDFDITAKDIRGYNANKWIVEKLQASDIPKEEKERKRKFIGITKKVAEKIGHTRFTLTKHYMVPELPQEYIVNGKIIDLKELGYYKEGGDV